MVIVGVVVNGERLARTQDDLSGIFSALGAQSQFATMLPVALSALGPEHSQTLTVRASLARWAAQAGDPETTNRSQDQKKRSELLNHGRLMP